MTAELFQHGINLETFNNFSPDDNPSLGLNKRTLALLEKRGLLDRHRDEYRPTWSNEVTFVWHQKFREKGKTHVHHQYAPSTGFGSMPSRKVAKLPGEPTPYVPFESVSYILTTARNWSGPIEDFHLVVTVPAGRALRMTKWSPKLEEIEAGIFETRIKDFLPAQDLDIEVYQAEKER